MRSLLLPLLLPAVALAQELRPEHQAIADAWTAFTAEQGPLWKADWNPATVTPKAIYGTGIRVQDAAIEDIRLARRYATETLDRYAKLLGRGESTFVETIGVPTDNVFVFVYDQRFRGLRVTDARADVRVHRSGVVSMFGSQAVHIPSGFSINPTVEADLAWALAHQHLRVTPEAPAGAVTVEPNAELVIHADIDAKAEAVPQLAWQVQVDVRTGPEPVVGKVFVDARTGAVLRHIDEVYRCSMGHTHVRGESETGANGHIGRDLARGRRPAAPVAITGNVQSYINLGKSPLDPLTNTPLQGLRVTAQGVGTAFTDANGDFSIPYTGTAPVTVSVDFGTGSGEHIRNVQALTGTPVSASVQATPGTPAQIQLLSQNAPDSEWSQPTVFWFVDDANRWLRSLVGNVGPMNAISQVTATVNRASTCNAYYTANSINFYSPGGGCNMTAFSSVIYHEWGHGLDDQFGGISQVDGLSEGWGDILSIYRLDDPIVGKDFTTTGGIVRTALNNVTYPPGGFPSGGAPHPKGECWMGWAWEVRRDLIQSLGRTAGIARADAIVVASIVGNARNQPDAVREVFLLDDDDGNLANGTPNYGVLEAASIRRRLPYPELQIVDITHAPLGTFDRPLEPRLVRADLTALTGTIQQAEIVYGALVPSLRRPLLPTGNGDEHVALLPGVVSPSAVRYVIEVQHSSGRTVKLPREGFFEYRVGQLTQIYSESFEGSTAGWNSSGAGNEWQFGAPAGRTGSSLGFNWADPTAAADGRNVVGVDLGITGQGAYEWFCNQTLTAPGIDLRSATAPTLRYKRWLSVAPLDAAQFTANGQVLFTSSGESETGWQQLEYDLTPFVGQTLNLAWNLSALLPFRAGGWNIDDLEISDFAAVPGPAVEMRVTPEQVPLGGSVNLSVQGAANAAVAVLLSVTPGPLTVPGIGELFVAGQINVLPTVLDANGQLTQSVPAPTDPATIGSIAYGQVVQVAGGRIDLSNGMIVLFSR